MDFRMRDDPARTLSPRRCATVWAAPLLLAVAVGGLARPALAQVSHEETGDVADRFRSADELPATKGLPDPFRRADGARVGSRTEWTQHRRYLVDLLEHYQYGRMPPPPARLTARELSRRELLEETAVETRVLLSCGPNGEVRFRVGLTRPKGPGPFGVVFKNEASLGPHCPILAPLLRNGYMFVEYVRTDLDPDAPATVGPAQGAYPDRDWGTIAVWAWGAMRLVDYLSTLDDVDTERIVCTGHSRGGKAALLATALDERIAVVVANGSGAGGAGSYRVQGAKSESLDAITDPKRFAYWFHPRLRTFAGREDRLPFDQHFLAALVAPRSLLLTEASGDLWSNPLGTQHVYSAAREVYEFLGAEAKVGLHARTGGHDQRVEDWEALLDFAELQLSDRAPPASRRFDRLLFPTAEKAFEWSAPAAVDTDYLATLGLRYELQTLRLPRPNRVHVLRVDLANERIRPRVVVGADPDGDGPAEAALTDPFTLAADPDVVAFVNTNPWDALPDADGKKNRRWYAGQPVDIHALVASGGQVRSPALRNGASVWFDRRQRVVLGDLPVGASGIEGVAGFSKILAQGAIVTSPDGPLHPRTAIGVDRTGLAMWLVVVDGRQKGYSEGMSLHELARLMRELGCWTATNMDGGGSSIMGIAGADAPPRVVNSPSGRRARPVPAILTIRRAQRER